MGILNNREWALVVWFFVFVIFALISPKIEQVRQAFKGVLRALFVKAIITTLALVIIYITIIILGLTKIGLWESHQLKNTIIWAISVGALSLFKIDSAKKDSHFFRNSVLDNLKLIAIIQFVVGVYTFGFFVELILVPILAVLGAMLAIAKTDDKYHLVEKILNGVLATLGIIFILHTIYMLATSFGQFAKTQTIYNFSIPPLLTFLYLPFIFIMMIFTTYELVFVRLQYLIKEPKVRRFAKIYSMGNFHFKIKLLERWASTLPFQDTSSKEGIKNSFKQVFRMVSAETKPQKVPLREGWSPYEAKNFLLSEGFETGYYHPTVPEEWFASSPLIELGNDVIPNNISYYVEGSESTAKSLKLNLNVNSHKSAELAHSKLLSSVKVLLKSALGLDVPSEIETAIMNGENITLNLGSFMATCHRL